MKNITTRTIMLKGEPGSSISRIEEVSTVGNVTTYAIYFNDDTPVQYFEVYNANVSNDMTATDPTTVAPSIEAIKNYINNVGGNDDGVLFCGDFINYPDPQIDISSDMKNVGGYRACGWYIPPWLEWSEGEGLHVAKTPVGNRNSFASPQYVAAGHNMKDFGVDQAIITVEWAKKVGDNYEIHTSFKVITDTSAEIGRPIVNFETDVNFAMMYLYNSQTFPGAAVFGMYISAQEIVGDYYIRKIKIEKGTIPTPFGLNRDQFLTNNILKNLFYEGNQIGTTDANGVYYSAIDISGFGDITNLKIAGAACKCGDDVFFSDFPPYAVEFGYRLAWDPSESKTWLHVNFKYPSAPNTNIKFRFFYSSLRYPWA